jgi:hypothetical protein
MGVFGDSTLKQKFITDLGNQFDISDKGKLQYYLGINIQKHGASVTLDQKKYIKEILQEFDLTDQHPVVTPMHSDPPAFGECTTPCDNQLYRRMVGCLVYLVTCTRPDLAYPVSCASKHLQAPTMADMSAVIQIYRYLIHTIDDKLTFDSRDCTPVLTTDANYAGCTETSRSQTAWIISMFGGLVAWKSTRQPTVARSTAEAEFMAMCTGAQEIVFLKQFLTELQIPDRVPPQTLPLLMRADNHAAIKMAAEGADSTRSKHINIRYHFLKELCADKVIEVQYVQSSDNSADMLTKCLQRVKLNHNKALLNLKP